MSITRVSVGPVPADSTGFQDWGWSWQLANGGYVAAWADDPSRTNTFSTPLLQNGINLQMRVFGPDGNPVTGDITVNQSGKGFYPRMANLGEDQFVVVWYSQSDGSGWGQLNGRVFDNNGTPATAEFRVNDWTSWSVVGETTTGFVVASHPTRESLMIQSFSFTGNPIGTPTSIAENYGDLSYIPIGLSSGGYYLVYQATNGQLYFQKFNDAAIVVGSPIQLNDAGSSNAGSSYIDAVTLRSGVNVITWVQTDATGTRDTHAKLIDDNGSTIGQDILVGQTSSTNDTEPRITKLIDGGFAVAWKADSNGYVQLFDSSGQKTGNIHTISIGSIYFVAISPAPDGGIVTTWSNNGNIFAVHIDKTGLNQSDPLLLNDHNVANGTVMQTAHLQNDGTLSVTWIDKSLSGGLGVEFYRAEISFGDTSGGVTCFLAGTLIRTPNGDVPVENLEIGQPVVLYDGSVLPVKWIGRQTIAPRFADPLKTAPICIKAGAFAESVPSKDLYTSAGHAMLIDGILATAGALVNNSSIVRAKNNPLLITYYHVELERHTLIFANDAPTETFVDNVSRETFDNFADYISLYGEGQPIKEMGLPVAKSARQLPFAVCSRLRDRQAALAKGDAVAA